MTQIPTESEWAILRELDKYFYCDNYQGTPVPALTAFITGLLTITPGGEIDASACGFRARPAMKNLLTRISLCFVVAAAAATTSLTFSPADAHAQARTRIKDIADFEGVREKASLISPVPGGVGPMTVTMLLFNTLRSAERTVGIGGSEPAY